MARAHKAAEAASDSVFSIPGAKAAAKRLDTFSVITDVQSMRVENGIACLEALSQLASSEVDELNNAGGYVEVKRRDLSAIFAVLATYFNDTVGFEATGQAAIDPALIRKPGEGATPPPC